MSPLEAYLADSMEETMQPYTLSDEYKESRTAINKAINTFRSTLSDTQKADFNRLMDMVNNADAEYSSKAYVFGVVNGITLRDGTLRP